MPEPHWTNLPILLPRSRTGTKLSSQDHRQASSLWNVFALWRGSCFVLVRPAILTLLLLFSVFLLMASSWADEVGIPRRVLAAASDSLPAAISVVEGRDIRFRRLPRSSGLSQTRVGTVAQDSHGFIWFGTQYGLNRFDGYKSKVFKHEIRRTESLSCVYVRTLLVDHAGRLWVGCNGVLDRYEPTTETFVHFPIHTEIAGTMSQISDLSEDHSGRLWISTTKGLYRFDPGSSQTTRYLHDPRDPDSLSASLINQAQEDRMGRLWIASGGGLDEFDSKQGKVKRRAPMRMAVGYSHLDRFGILWMTGEDLACALASWDLSTDRFKCHSIQYPEKNRMERLNIGRMIEDDDGTLWLSSSHGLLKLGADRRKLIRYHSDPVDSESLESDKMISIFRDREGNIWPCFQVTGPNYFAQGPKSFENFTYQRGELVDPLVTSIYEDRRGILWIGSMGGLNRIDRRTGKNIVPPGSGVRNEILSIMEDRSQVLFSGTYHHGLEKIDPVSGQMSSYVQSKHSNSAKNPIMRLMFDHAGDLWAATYGGVGQFNPKNGNFTFFTPDPHDSIEYQAIVEDTDGTIWLGAQTGLHHFLPTNQQFAIYQHRADVPNSLSDNRVNTIHIDRSGGVWVGTQNGLDKFDKKTGSFAVYTEREGLGGNVVSCILEDRQGALWMSTNNGVSRLDPQVNKFENYSPADGLPGPDLTGWGACYQSPSGEMFFGGFSGATAFYPDRIAHHDFVPSVALTDFRLSGVSLSPGLSSLLPNSITLSKAVEIAHTQRDFSIEFSALSFFDPETNRYRYRLKELDSNWHEVGSSQRLASYTTLPVGSYTFEVAGATNHGRWSEPTRLGIRILPAWYQTQMFRASVLFAVSLSLWAIYLIRIKSLKHRFEVILETRVAERTRIARDLHDTVLQSLHGLMFRFQAARNMLPHRAEEAMEVLDGAIARTEQAIAEGRDAIKALRTAQPDQGDFAGLLAATAAELAHSAEDKEQLPICRVTVEGEPLRFNPSIQEEVYRIAYEALQNAFRHSKAEHIEVEVRYSVDAFRLRLRDDGIGIAQDVLTAGGRSGHWGLAGIRERAEQMGATLTLWSRPGAGTEIHFLLPAKRAYPDLHGSTQFKWFIRKERT
jgi:ligand-binding sensor domain-containing protein/signal transduction histidine kinase